MHQALSGHACPFAFSQVHWSHGERRIAFRNEVTQKSFAHVPCRRRGRVARENGHHPSLVVRAAAKEQEEEVDIEEDAMTRMEKSLESTTSAFATVRTGRANAAMLDRIMVDYYGAPTPLRQIANLSAPEASLLVIQPYDKSSIQSIEKAIMASDLNLTPNNDGNLIRINVPQLTAERRKDMTKMVSKLGEDGKIAIRNIRRDCMKAVDKMKDASEDEQKTIEDAVQELTDEYVKQVDKIVKTKQDELTTV